MTGVHAETAAPREALDGARVLFGVGGLIAVALGAFVLFAPVASANVALLLAAALVGIYAVVTGLVYLGVAIFTRGTGGWSRVGHSLLGLLYVIGGVVIFSNLLLSGGVLAIFLSVTLGVLWILEAVLAFATLKTSENKGWTVVYAIVSIVAGLTLILSPLMGAVTIWWLFGISMVVLGIVQIARAFKLGAAK